ncbi:MAG: sigma-70 family RNA polymerase sigma factor [Planctomycetes bacterium]|nr:sigma-70 family RNA polymerase sigma factor [Planctomycetota bacterium]
MADSSTTQLQLWIERINSGDAAAGKQLVGHTCERLRRLTRKMLRDFPGVRRQEDTDDVLNSAVLRLLRALEVVPLTSVAEFFRLAALQIRRELLDLARLFTRRREITAPNEPRADEDSSGSTPPPLADDSDSTYEPQRLARWTEFHQHVEALPVELREVFGLRWYHGLTEAQAAAVLNISRATLKRRWLEARLRLQDAMGGALPGADVLRGGQHP